MKKKKDDDILQHNVENMHLKEENEKLRKEKNDKLRKDENEKLRKEKNDKLRKDENEKLRKENEQFRKNNVVKDATIKELIEIK